MEGGVDTVSAIKTEFSIAWTRYNKLGKKLVTC